ncbi:hypothetical protein A6I84_03495 [Prescottella equi]|nr:hypothetical protein A6I84_03495 [Prescottella equi]
MLSVNKDERRKHCVNWMSTTGQKWLTAGDYTPKPGSDLAGDDTIRPEPSGQAVFAIAVGLDHFGSVTTALGSPQGLGFARHFAPYSALRAALLTASQAVWILGPTERKERQRRSLILARTSVIEHRKAIKAFDLKAPTEKQIEGKQATLDALGKQLELIEKTASDAGLDALADFNSTAAIQAAVKIVDPTDEWFGLAIEHLWRSGSAAAHGYSWRLSHQKDPQVFDIDQFDMALQGSWLMVSHAIELYEQRAT